MHIGLNAREQGLLELLTVIPPDTDGAERYLQEKHLSCGEITRAALEYAGCCYCEVGDLAHEQKILHPENKIPGLHSTYILDVLRLLLRYGLEPNGAYAGCNIMDSMRFLDNELLAADALALLLEHGGKADMRIPGEEETLFQTMDFDVFFGAVEQYDRQQYAAIVHCWMVLLGYGARNGEEKMQVFREYDCAKEFDLRKLKEHRKYYFGVSHTQSGFAISIYDKDTLWEVARIG